MNSSTQLIVARKDFKISKIIETPLPALPQLPDDGLLVKVDRFAFTANNITYAILGDQLKYWDLFPAPDGFGIIPVWGLGDVVESRHPDIAKGEKKNSSSEPTMRATTGAGASSYDIVDEKKECTCLLQ